MTESEDPKKILAKLLVEQQLLHQAQIDLALNDMDISGIPLDEILVFRGWISQEKLYEVAPWLKGGPVPTSKPAVSKPAAQPAKPSEPSPTSAAAQKPATTDNGTQTKTPPPEDLPKQPPLIPTATPPLKESPLAKNPEETLKAYKDMLRRVLSEKEQ